MRSYALVRTTRELRGPILPASLAIACTASAVFGLMAWFSIELTRDEHRIAAVWLPNAFALAFLLRARLPREDFFLAGAFAGNVMANIMAGDDAARAVLLSSANSIEILLALVIVRRGCTSRPDMRDAIHLLRFVLGAGILAPAASASLATATLALQGPVGPETWLKWLVTDGIGMIIVVPTALIFADALRRPRWPEQLEIMEWTALTIGGTALTLFVFLQDGYPLLFLIAPVVVSHAFRLGSLGTAFSMVKVSVISVACTSLGQGPVQLVEGNLTAQLLTLQIFLATVFMMGLPVAAVLHKRAAMLREIAASRAELDTLATSITDAVLRYDDAGVCVYASPSVEDVLGLPCSSFIGRSASSRVHPEAAELLAAAEARLVGGQSTRERITYRRFLDDPEGNPVFIEADCTATYDRSSGERSGTLVSARDVTSRVVLEQQLDRARRRAEEATQAKSEFLANMSHEIRTPMNGVLGFAELLLQGRLEDDQRRYAELIFESGRSMMQLLNSILDISKIEAGQIVLAEEAIDIRHLVASCARLHAAEAARKDIALSVEIDPAVPPAILADPLRLRQIVLNLVGNAVKFTEEGKVALRCRCAPDLLTIEVSDSGIGIPGDRLRDIFLPFQQADGRTSRRYGGTGLGLAISRQLAELMDGSIACASRPGEGSTFSLRIPLRATDLPTRLPASPHGRTGEAELPSGRILLVDDHDINRLLAGDMLQRCGQHVDLACDGHDAVAQVVAAEAKGHAYDLVLMDIQMPGCDGYQATRDIRSIGIPADRLPIIALTANAFPEDIEAAREAGMQGHLAKPIILADLMSVLWQWLPLQGHAPAPAQAPAPAPRKGRPSDVFGAATLMPASPSLHDRWMQRRREALDAVAIALQEGSFDPADREDLARLLHKLAGTAGAFGEDELGRRAGRLERALKKDATVQSCRDLARDILGHAAASA